MLPPRRVVPVPVTVIVAFPPLLVMARLAARAPSAVGAKLQMTVQLCAAASAVALAQVPLRTKSPGLAPPGVNVPSVNVPVPELVTETVWVALLPPTTVLGKLNESGLAVSTGAVGAVLPVPLRLIVALPPLLAIASVADRAPVVVGVN